MYQDIDNPARMDLTLFSETPGQETTPTTPAAAQTEQEQLVAIAQPAPGEARANSLAEYLRQREAATSPAATAQPPTDADATQGPISHTAEPPAQPKLFAGKFKSTEDMERSYSELEKWNTQLAQRYGLPPDAGTQRSVIDLARQQSQEIETLRAQIAAQGQQTGQVSTDGAQAQTNPLENLGMTAEEFTDLLYTQPDRVLSLLQEQAQMAAATQIQAWQHEQQTQAAQHQAQVDNWVNQLMHTQAVYNDFPQYKDQVVAYIEANPALEGVPNAVELAYKAVKADTLTSGPLTVEDVLSNDNFLSQILQSDKVKNQVLRSHAEAIRNNAPPPVISGQVPGLPPASGKEEIKSVRQATEAARAFFSKVTGR